MLSTERGQNKGHLVVAPDVHRQPGKPCFLSSPASCGMGCELFPRHLEFVGNLHHLSEKGTQGIYLNT